MVHIATLWDNLNIYHAAMHVHSCKNEVIIERYCSIDSIIEVISLTNLQQSFDPNCLPIVIPNENMIINEQCNFADGICNGQEFGNVPLMN